MTTHPEPSSLILIVDDVINNLQVLGNMLQPAGYKIAVATTGMQAIHIARAINPDLILLDVMMPEMDGFEVCSILKSASPTREVPIIFLTAKTETEDVVNGFATGAVDYVAKPFNSAELLQRVATHLALKKATDRQKQLISMLEEKNEALTRANYQLRERQNIVVKLMGDIARIRLSGERHAIRNVAHDERALSTKPKGGLGTKSLRDFLLLHKGYGYYEAGQSATRVHLYFERMTV